MQCWCGQRTRVSGRCRVHGWSLAGQTATLASVPLREEQHEQEQVCGISAVPHELGARVLRRRPVCVDQLGDGVVGAKGDDQHETADEQAWLMLAWVEANHGSGEEIAGEDDVDMH